MTAATTTANLRISLSFSRFEKAFRDGRRFDGFLLNLCSIYSTPLLITIKHLEERWAEYPLAR